MTQKLVSGLPSEVKQDHASLGALLYSCTAVAHDEELALHRELPSVAFQVTFSAPVMNHGSSGIQGQILRLYLFS